MLRLNALGGLVVHREGTLLKGAATQRRRLTLLAIIAVAGKKGISRDRLLTLLWPESGNAKGRHGLAQSLYALRRDLGDDALFLGTSELRLNPTAITSDIQDFRDAIDSGDLSLAASVYQGPLLDGVYVSEAPDFERWLDGERAHFTRQFSEVLELLAAEQKQKGEGAASSATLARLAGHDPLNKRFVVKAMQSLSEAGDIAGALAQADRHEAELRDELDLPAHADVLALRQTIAKTQRERALEAPQDETMERDRAPSIVTEPIPEPEQRAELEPAERHRNARYWIAGIAAIAIAATFIGQRAVSAGTGKTVESRVAVLPFAVRGSNRLAYLRDGMVDLLSQRLDGVGSLHTVDPNALLEFVREQPASESDLAKASDAASHFGAGQFIVGSIVDAGGSLQVSATLYSAHGKRISVATASAASESHLPNLIDDLARALVGSEMTQADARIGHEAALSTTSLPALKSFLQGEQEFRAAHYPSAVDAYQRAIAADSTFALAWYRLSTAAEWSSQSKLVSEAIRTAVRFESRLSAEEKMLLDARMASLEGNDNEVERLYRGIVESHPEDAEAWMQMGETAFHNAAWRGRPIAESRYAFEHVALLRSADVLPRLHLARLAALRNDRLALDTLNSATPLTDPDQLLEFAALRALGSGDRTRATQFMDSVERASAEPGFHSESALLAAWRIATFATDALSAERLALTATPSHNPTPTRLAGFLAAAHMAAARGRWNESQKFLAAASSLDQASATRARANLLGSGVFPASTSSLRQLIEQIRTLQPTGANARKLRLFDASLAGRLAIMEGDSSTVRTSSATIAEIVRSDSSLAILGAHLQNQLEARAAFASQNTRGALSLVEKGWPRVNPQARYPWLQNESYSMAAGRYLRARLLDESGQIADALPWYETIAEDQGYATIYLAPSYIRRAVAEERLGHPQQAAELYERFISLWRDADAALQPQVQFAMTRLARLSKKK